MSVPMNVLIFAGSTREGSLNRKVAHCAAAAAGVVAETTLLDLREHRLPLYDGDLESSGVQIRHLAELRALFKSHRVWLIASPDYNSSMSPLIKNLIDWVSRPLNGENYVTCFKEKQVGLMSSSSGSSGGARGLPHLRHVLTYLGARVSDRQFVVPRGHEAFDAGGALFDVAKQQELETFVRSAVREAASVPSIAAAS